MTQPAITGPPASTKNVSPAPDATASVNVPSQPYHYAAELSLAEAEKYLAGSAALCRRFAADALSQVVRELEAIHYRVAGAAVLLASGRPLPALEKILAAHPLIHSAEGGFFRDAVHHACDRLKIPVTAIKQRDLDALALTAFGAAATPKLLREISALRDSIGPPWTADHKAAALAAALVLAQKPAARKSG